MFSQIATVVGMNIKSLPRRLWMSLAAIFAVSVVVAVLLAFLAMAKGFEKTLTGSGSESIAVITRIASQSELNSILSRQTVNTMATAPGIARNANGDPIYSAELFVIVDGIKRSSQTEVNIPMRGISAAGFELRENVRIVEGRSFEAGRNEIVVGEGIPSNNAVCTRCGARLPIPVPLSVTAFSKWVAYQEEVHKTCLERPACTGVSASWCPRCGDCECPRDEETGELEGDMNDAGCPLHAPSSTHAAGGPHDEDVRSVLVPDER